MSPLWHEGKPKVNTNIMKSFEFKNRTLTSGPHLLGLLLILSGLLALLSLLFFRNEGNLEKTLGIGLGAILLGLIIVFTYTGTLIDSTEKRFKVYFSICGYKLGQWRPLPSILTVKVTTNSYISTNTPNGIHPTLSGRVTDYRTLIYSNTFKPVFSFIYSNREMAAKDAEHLAANLKADLDVSESV